MHTIYGRCFDGVEWSEVVFVEAVVKNRMPNEDEVVAYQETIPL
jgi:hypothetical protein